MAWTTPSTFTASNVLEAADLNEQLRDNMSYVHSGKPATVIARNNTTDYTPGASFADVDTTNLSITLSVTTGRVLVMVACQISAVFQQSYTCSFDVTVDGTRQGGSDGIYTGHIASGVASTGVGFPLFLTGLSTGSHTFRLQAKASGSGALTSSGTAYIHFSAAEW